MSSLRAKVKKQFQLCLEFLGPNVVVVRNFDLLVTIEHVDKNNQSLKVYLQKTSLKKKVEEVDE
jgi:hypothetical protein